MKKKDEKFEFGESAISNLTEGTLHVFFNEGAPYKITLEGEKRVYMDGGYGYSIKSNQMDISFEGNAQEFCKTMEDICDLVKGHLSHEVKE